MTSNIVDGQSSVTVSQFGYLGIGVSNLGAWREFSTDLLGLQENGESARGDVFLRLDAYHHRFILREDGSDDLAFQGWEVKSGAELDAMAAKVRGFGLSVTDGTAEDAAERMVSRLIKFTDPDGIPTEIYYGPLLDHRPFVSPRGINSFIAGNMGFGHIVISVEDPESYIRYLTDVLGARISDHIVMQLGPMSINLTFLHVNPRHHSIAVMSKISLPGAPKGRLQHMMIEADTIDAIGIAHDLFQQRGFPTGAIGRHTNDHMLSFYGETPSGFHIEYGFGGSLIEDDSNWSIQTYRAPSVWGHGMLIPPP